MVFLACLISCRSATIDANAIVEQESIELTLVHFHCFGSGIQKVNIFNENGHRTLTSEHKGYEISDKRRIDFDDARKELLLAVIKEGLSLNDTLSICTDLTTYSIVTEDFTCKFQDANCSRSIREKMKQLVLEKSVSK